jgi:hypothetical protein
MLPPLRLSVLARVPHIFNITSVRIAKARAATSRSRSADFYKHGFFVAARKSFLLCFHAIANFLNPDCCDQKFAMTIVEVRRRRRNG